MTNAQLYLAYIIPTVLVLLGVLMNRSDNQAVRGDIQALRTEMVALRNQIHSDMVALHERVAVVEAKQEKGF